MSEQLESNPLSSSADLGPAVPIFRVEDLDVSVAYYIDRLGFHPSSHELSLGLARVLGNGSGRACAPVRCGVEPRGAAGRLARWQGYTVDTTTRR
jgi:hypothetical protein